MNVNIPVRFTCKTCDRQWRHHSYCPTCETTRTHRRDPSSDKRFRPISDGGFMADRLIPKEGH